MARPHTDIDWLAWSGLKMASFSELPRTTLSKSSPPETEPCRTSKILQLAKSPLWSCPPSNGTQIAQSVDDPGRH